MEKLNFFHTSISHELLRQHTPKTAHPLCLMSIREIPQLPKIIAKQLMIISRTKALFLKSVISFGLVGSLVAASSPRLKTSASLNLNERNTMISPTISMRAENMPTAMAGPFLYLKHIFSFCSPGLFY